MDVATKLAGKLSSCMGELTSIERNWALFSFGLVWFGLRCCWGSLVASLFYPLEVATVRSSF